MTVLLRLSSDAESSTASPRPTAAARLWQADLRCCGPLVAVMSCGVYGSRPLRACRPHLVATALHAQVLLAADRQLISSATIAAYQNFVKGCTSCLPIVPRRLQQSTTKPELVPEHELVLRYRGFAGRDGSVELSCQCITEQHRLQGPLRTQCSAKLRPTAPARRHRVQNGHRPPSRPTTTSYGARRGPRGRAQRRAGWH